MTIRNAVLGLAVVFGVSLWSWSRPCGQEAHGAEVVVASDGSTGGNHDEAVARYRANQSRHWRQVAIGH